jgi:hypothetical protein
MNDSLQPFLDTHLPMKGVVAWSARLPGSAVSSHCYHEWLSTPQIEQAFDSLTLAAINLSSHGIQPLQLCSVFEHLRIYLSLREDGACLALFVENRPSEATDALNRLLEDFRVVTF